MPMKVREVICALWPVQDRRRRHAGSAERRIPTRGVEGRAKALPGSGRPPAVDGSGSSRSGIGRFPAPRAFDVGEHGVPSSDHAGEDDGVEMPRQADSYTKPGRTARRRGSRVDRAPRPIAPSRGGRRGTRGPHRPDAIPVRLARPNCEARGTGPTTKTLPESLQVGGLSSRVWGAADISHTALNDGTGLHALNNRQ